MRADALRPPVYQILSCSELLLEEAGDLGILDQVADLTAIQVAGHQLLAFIDGPVQDGVRPLMAELLRDVAERIRRLLNAPGNPPEAAGDFQAIASAANQLIGLIGTVAPTELRADPASARATGSVQDRKSTRLNSSHIQKSRMPSSA